MLVSPQDDPGMVRETMRERGFVGIKPYRLYAPFADTTQVRIEDFAPDWMWELCHEINGVLISFSSGANGRCQYRPETAAGLIGAGLSSGRRRRR